jgi:hypothetical protein
MIIDKLIYDWQKEQFPSCHLITSNNIIDTKKTLFDFINNYIFNNNSTLNNNPDFLLITPENNQSKSTNYITIDQARLINGFLSKSPWSNTSKVVIIPNAEKININASNALLKIMEDTPCNCYFFLICSSVFDVIKTLASRCRVIQDTKYNVKNIDNKYLKLLTSYDEGKINNFRVSLTKESKHVLWKEFCQEVRNLIGKIISAETKNIESFTEEESAIYNAIKKKYKMTFPIINKIKHYIELSIKHDLDYTQIFFLIHQFTSE